jgi:outer membrane receptor for ferrienterochelin and colicin
MSQMVSLTAGVDNLFDTEPNRYGAGPGRNGAGTTLSQFYDVLGRRYYASVRLSSRAARPVAFSTEGTP